ncbi:WASp [Trypoxylus dichotomus]
MAQKQRKQIENKSSILLTLEENQQIFRLVGSRCKTIATAVVQLYHTQSPNHLQWVKKDTGVLCFVRDNVRKTYFFRLFCLKRNCMVWEQETYTQMEYDHRCPFLHTFEGDKCIYAFNFASTLEADETKQIITDKLARRRKADYKNVSRKSDTVAVPVTTDSYQSSDQKSLNIDQVAALKKKRRRNLTKADIGNPSGFRHVSHIGWHRDKGLDVNIKDSVYQEIFKKAGIGEQDLQNRKTREFIVDFIQNYSDIESIQQEAKNSKPAAPAPSSSIAPVPPVPPRSAPKPPHNRAAPPPPPSSNQPPPRPAQYRIGVPPPPPGNAPPPPPLPLSTVTNGNSSSSSIPPPPPPPLLQESSCAMNNQLPPMDNSDMDMRSALMQSIREGANLRPVEASETKSNECDRNDMLRKIREGVSLKSAADREIKAPTTPVNQVPDIAMALRKALETRSNRIHSDSDTGSDTSNDDEWDA